MPPAWAGVAGVGLVIAGVAPGRRFALVGAVIVIVLCFRWDEALMRHHRYLLGCCLLWLGAADSDERARTLLKLQFSALYAWAIVDKLDLDWLSGRRLLWTLAEVWPRGFWLLWPRADVVFGVGACVVVVAEGVIAVVPWRRPRLGLLLVLGFHGAIELLLPVGVFGLVMATLACVFLRPPQPRRYRSGMTPT